MNNLILSTRSIDTLVDDIANRVLLRISESNLLSSHKEKIWLTRKEKADQLNISVSMVDKLVRIGELQKKKIGRKTLIKA